MPVIHHINDPVMSQVALGVRHAMITLVRGLFTSFEAPLIDDTVTINRQDFGPDFPAGLPGGGLLLSDDVRIEIDGSAVRQG